MTVQQDAMGDFSVDMGRWGWFPEMLPSEEVELEEGNGEESTEGGDVH